MLQPLAANRLLDLKTVLRRAEDRIDPQLQTLRDDYSKLVRAHSQSASGKGVDRLEESTQALVHRTRTIRNILISALSKGALFAYVGPPIRPHPQKIPTDHWKALAQAKFGNERFRSFGDVLGQGVTLHDGRRRISTDSTIYFDAKKFEAWLRKQRPAAIYTSERGAKAIELLVQMHKAGEITPATGKATAKELVSKRLGIRGPSHNVFDRIWNEFVVRVGEPSYSLPGRKRRKITPRD
jgi:polyhydroxyalkanoate synthesis regulator phasin